MLKALLQRLIPPATGRVDSTDAAAREADRLISEGRREEDAGNVREACKRYGDAVSLAPHYPAAHLNLGVGLEASGDTDGASGCYEAVLALEPDNPFANYNLGKLHFLRRNLSQAERHLRAALEGKPEFWEAQVVLANLLDARGDAAAAATVLESAIRRRSDDFGAWFLYGQMLLKLGRETEAESALKRALSLDPRSVDANGTLAGLYQERGAFAAAVPHLEAALKVRPGWVVGLFSYAHALMRLRRFDEADAALIEAIAIEPGRDDLHQARMDILGRSGRIAEMLELCRARRALFPDRMDYKSSELFTLNFIDDISAEEHFALHKAFGDSLEKTVSLRFLPFRNRRDPGRRLRIGYFSGEFYLHPVGRFMLPLIERHDRSAFEVYCYSVCIFPADSMMRQLKETADVWRDGKTMDDAKLAGLVHDDQIDILIDLSGHSGVSRLPVLAHQPAPVQATWLGNLNTTGLTRVHYRITDYGCDPPGMTERFHTEQLMRLPNCQWCYRQYVEVDVPREAPLEKRGTVTFGSFTQFAKLTPSTLSLWAMILREVTDSRLILAGVPEGRIRSELLEKLAHHGVDSSKVVLRPFMSMHDYMRTFGEVDIALDTTPYSGGTTTCDALWMGVPVLTCPGMRPTSRSAASILTTIGLSDWVAASPDDYVRRAMQFAAEKDTIVDLRRSLRDRMRASPLMQEAQFARDLEQLYRTMWRRWCAGEHV